MPKKHLVPKLPERDRKETLDAFLAVLDQHPNLAHFRALVRTGPERQLALFAALERSVVIGVPATAPPSHDDEPDQLLCDILDVIDQHPELKKRCAYYGPDRPLALLQALGVWHSSAPIDQPSARELFTTSFSNLTADPPGALPPSEVNYSPAPQDFSSGGDLISPSDITQTLPNESSPSPQTVDGVLVVAISPGQEVAVQSREPHGLIHHADQKSGEQLPDAPTDPRTLPARVVRRGRPIKLDDLAKGRLLGLMSYGLSFRQAAAQLGVHHVTLLNAMKRDEEFAQQVSEARLDAISQPLLTVVQASRTSWRAAAWLAKFLEDRRNRSYESTPEERELARRK